MAPEISFNQRIVIGMILALIVALNFLIAWTIFKKNKPNFKPMNIFLANYFVGIGFLSLSGMIVTISKDKDDIGQICPKEFLSYFCNINNICSVFVLQLYRLVAVCYPYYYAEMMDVSKSLQLVGASLLP